MIPISKPLIGPEEEKAVLEVLKSGMIAQGPKVKEFEEKFAAYCGSKHAIAMNSGTAALHACMHALGLKPGDEVITTPFTFVASANSILMQGAKPVFADIEEETFNLDTKQVEKKITPKTKAILTVNLYGQICHAQAFKDLAKKHNLKLIEDACQSVGAEADGMKSGVIGDIAAFSFYATKNLMCGEGGIVTTNNAEWAELCKRFRHHGQSEQTRYEYYDIGYNYRMMDLVAVIGLAQLAKIDNFTKKRIENATKLTEGLKNIKEIVVPKILPSNKHVFHQYTIKVLKDRDKLLAHLKEKGIGAGIYYPKPLHLHPHFAKLGYKKGDFPVSERVSEQVLSLPVHPALTEEDIKMIIKTIKDFYEKA